MKTRLTISFLFVLTGFLVFSQGSIVKGKVTDAQGEGVYNATVVIFNTQIGAKTDFDGNYELGPISISADREQRQILIRALGYPEQLIDVELLKDQSVQLDFTLGENMLNLEETVVIGYGTTRTKDLTGAATKIKSEDFNETPAATPEQLIQGKVAGVKINSNDGAPGSGSTIRLRGGTSINASNDPLIVVDGVPLDNGGIAGSANALSLINPNEIESFTILKDASATAIYGSRGANGVILITTKGGKGINMDRVHVELDISTTISKIAKYADVLNGDQFRELVQLYGNASQISLLGEDNTDWQRAIYRTGIVNNYNISIYGGIKSLPYRLSAGMRLEDGILRRDELKRHNISLNLNPSFFDDHLTFDIQTKYSRTYSFFADRGAIGAANRFDPTQPLYSGSSEYGGYFEWLQLNGNPSTLAPKNPLGLLTQRNDFSNVDRFIGNFRSRYKFHFLPEMSLVVNGGTDLSEGRGEVSVNSRSAAGFYSNGSFSEYRSQKRNKLLEAYLNYNSSDKIKDLLIDATLGYAYQDWETSTPNNPVYNYNQDSIIFPADPFPFYTANALLSYYGRGIVNYKEKYVFTTSLRTDASSRFSPETRWGLFPSASAAWIISNESFLADVKGINLLKLRFGYGVTGQQDIGSDYPYIPNYQQGTLTAQYYFGGTYYTVLRPDGYDANIKWEQTKSYNLGIDFGILKDRINGSLDLYYKRTDDLLAVVPVMAGTNFTKQILTNVGSMENKGIEFAINTGLVAKKDFRMDAGFNISYNLNKVLSLTQVPDTTSPGIPVGGIAGGIGNFVQIHTVGYPTFSYYVFEQQYDAQGMPIEAGSQAADGSTYTELDAFVDRNNDGVINEEDRYRFENVAPDVFIGLNLEFSYKRWFAGMLLRGELGGYIYNNVHSNAGTFQSVGTLGFLNNISSSYYQEEFEFNTDKQLLSDHYVEKANFLRMDYLNIGYRFKEVLSVSVNVNNVFVLTKYSGLDPEVVGGIDNNIYPRPRFFTLNLNYKF